PEVRVGGRLERGAADVGRDARDLPAAQDGVGEAALQVAEVPAVGRGQHVGAVEGGHAVVEVADADDVAGRVLQVFGSHAVRGGAGGADAQRLREGVGEGEVELAALPAEQRLHPVVVAVEAVP